MNKIALITGGVRRLGRYVTYYLANEGYDLAIIYNSSSKAELDKTKAHLNTILRLAPSSPQVRSELKIKFYKCDIKDLKKLKNTVQKIGDDFKKIDVLVNNSGIIKQINFTDITQKLFDDTIDVNLRAMLFTSQFCLPYLLKSKEPQIINFASLGGLLNWIKYIPYSISKAGVIKLTQLLAKTLAPKIRVNAIAPGTIIIEGEEKDTPGKAPIERIPLKKYGNTNDIINAVDYLIKAKYVTGQIIAVEGGRILN